MKENASACRLVSPFLVPTYQEVVLLMVKVCAVFNVVVGGVVAVAGLFWTLLAIGFTEGRAALVIEALVILGPLVLTGILHVVSGEILLGTAPTVSGKALLFQGLAAFFAILFCVVMWIVNFRDTRDQGAGILMLLPSGFALVAVTELVFLWGDWKKGKS